MPAPGRPPPTLESLFRELQAASPLPLQERILASASGAGRFLTMLCAEAAGRSGSSAGTSARRLTALLREILHIVSWYEGRIDRFTANAVLAVFGAPCSHEDDPERAVFAAA